MAVVGLVPRRVSRRVTGHVSFVINIWIEEVLQLVSLPSLRRTFECQDRLSRQDFAVLSRFLVASSGLVLGLDA